MNQTFPATKKCKEPDPGETSALAQTLPRLAPKSDDVSYARHEARVKAFATPRGPAHATKWRNVDRSQDPLADPRLLEMADVISDFHSPGAVVAFCDSRVDTRVGQ